MLRTLVYLILPFVFAARVFAEEPECKEGSTQTGAASVQWMNITTVGRGCSVKISTENAETYTRRYVFSEGGVMEVVNRYGRGPSSATNGSRAYFIFPRHQRPAAEILKPGKNIKVTTSAGDTIYFNTEGKVSVTDDEAQTFHVVQSETVSKSNQGGAEIILSGDAKRLVLDCGFKMGSAPFTDLRRSSTFRDANGNRCTLSNASLFKINQQGEGIFKFSQDADLYSFLRGIPACKGLEFPPESLSSRRVLKATGPGRAIPATDWDAAAESQTPIAR